MGDGLPMGKIKNLSLKKTLLFYMAVTLFCSFLLSAVINRGASHAQLYIWWRYVDQDAYYEAAQKGPLYVPDIPRPQEYEMTSSDYFVSEVCDFLQTYTVLILSIAGRDRKSVV